MGITVIAFGVYAMLRGGKDGPRDQGGLGPISERGIHVLAGLRITIFGVVCVAAAVFALFRFS